MTGKCTDKIALISSWLTQNVDQNCSDVSENDRSQFHLYLKYIIFKDEINIRNMKFLSEQQINLVKNNWLWKTAAHGKRPWDILAGEFYGPICPHLACFEEFWANVFFIFLFFNDIFLPFICCIVSTKKKEVDSNAGKEQMREKKNSGAEKNM